MKPYTNPTATGVRGGGALDGRVRSVISRARWASRGERTGAAAWPVAAALLAALVIDASMPLPAVVRAGVGVLLLLMTARVILGLIPARAVRRMKAERAARLIEERAGVAGNALINALQLRRVLAGPAGAGGDEVTRELSRRVVARGDEQARGITVKGVVDVRGVKRAWGVSLIVAAVVGAVWLASPRLFAMGLPRIADPFGDHPPFTMTDFQASWEPARVLAGDDVTVRVTLNRKVGAVATMLDFVAVDERGRAIDRSAMSAQAGTVEDARTGEFTAIIRDVRAPARFRVEGKGAGVSRVWTIEPEMRPRIESVELRVRPPAYTGLDEVVHTGVSLGEDREAIGVLVGSTVVLRVLTTMELQSVEQPGASVTAGAGVSGREAFQELRFDAPGERTLAIRPVGVGGLACDDSATARLRVIEDAPPSVVIEEPARAGEVFVLAGAAAPMAGVATDDVAVTSLDLRWRLIRSEATAGDGSLSWTSGLGRSAEGRVSRSTTDFGASAGDRIEVWFEARDARAPEFGGPQRGVSETVTIRVLDREEFARRFAEELTAESITRPYEELARAAERLDERAQDLRAEARELARDMDRLGADEALPEAMERSARALERRAESFGDERDALADEIRRRLDLPDAVEFDQQMREPLERLLERLEAMETPQTPGLAKEPSDDDGAQEESGEQPTDPQDAGEESPQGDQPESDPGAQSQQLDRARVGEWLEKLNEALEEDAPRAALAADEAGLDIQRPAAALELADQLQRTLEQVDDAARKQRLLADRLATMTEGDETAREELAARQEAIQAQIEQSVRDLRTLGDRAAHELGSRESPSALARSILDERTKVQGAIDAVGDAAVRLPSDLAGDSTRALIQKSAELVMDEVYRQTAPIADGLSTLDAMPARDDEPGAEKLTPIVEEIRRALEVLEQIEAYLEEAGESYEETGGGSVALRSVLDVIWIAVIGAAPVELSADADAAVRAALDEARMRIQRLRATLRQAETGLTPLLPKMGQSAIDLAESVVLSDAPSMMEGAASMLRNGDLTGAAERALAAAEALESLYQDPGQGEPGEPSPQDMDQEMSLRKPGDPQNSEQSSGASGSSSGQSDGRSMGGGGKPNTLDQLSQNRRREPGGEQAGEQSGDQPGQQPGGEAQSGESPGGSPGNAEGGQGNRGAGSPAAPGGEAQRADDGTRERSRFFNQMLYEESTETVREVDGEVAQGVGGPSAGGSPSGRQDGQEGGGVSIPRGLTGAEAAAFVHVPPAYKDVVSAYFERIAREASRSGGQQ